MTKCALVIDEVVRRGSVRLTDIVTALEMPKSSAHRILNDLVAESLLVRDPHGNYSLGFRLIGWGTAAGAKFDVRQIALHHMRSLRDDTGETVNFHVPSGDHRVCIASLQGFHPLVPVIPLGKRLPLGRGAAGVVLFAFSPADAQIEAEKRLHELGLEIPSSETLELVRRARWWTVFGELEPGLSAGAAAVLTPAGTLVGALTVGGSAQRLTKERLESLRTQVIHHADVIGAEFAAAPS